ncbi:uncharacterized protein [Procambarus clarkii]|uniref:uncharacterized protein n=1 Tax=Procambarus clarkii TaxID=6728 RepID=UPI003743C8BE
MAQTRLFHISCKINNSSSVNSQLLSDVQSVLASVNKAVGAGNVQTNNLKSRINTLQSQLNQLGGPIIPLPIVQPVPPLAICPVKLPPRPPNRIHTTTRPNTHEVIRTSTRNITLDDLYSQFRRLYSVLKATDTAIMALTQVETLLKNLAAAIDVSITGHRRKRSPSEIIHGIQALIIDTRNAITTRNTSILSFITPHLNAARQTLVLLIQVIVNRSLRVDRDLYLAVHSSLETIENVVATANARRATIFREVTDLQRSIFLYGGTTLIVPRAPPFVRFPTMPIFPIIASTATPAPSTATPPPSTATPPPITATTAAITASIGTSPGPATSGGTTGPSSSGSTTGPVTSGGTTSPTTSGGTTGLTSSGGTTGSTTSGGTTRSTTSSGTTGPVTSVGTTSLTSSVGTTGLTTSGVTTGPITSGGTTGQTTLGVSTGPTTSGGTTGPTTSGGTTGPTTSGSTTGPTTSGGTTAS